MPGFDTVSDMLPNVAIPSISNALYGAGWDGVPSTSPAKNALYDEIARLEALATIVPGTYLPAVSGTPTSADTFIFNTSTYYRIGDTVFVNGWMRFIPRGGVSLFDITLPIPSNFTQVWHLAGAGGNGVQSTSFSLSISANTTTKKAQFYCKPSTAALTTNTNGYLFQYLVLP